MLNKGAVDIILDKAPGMISYHGRLENEAYAEMLTLHEEYKRVRSKKYLEKRAREGSQPVKDVEMELDGDSELTALKDREVLAEIQYRGHRSKRQYFENKFEAARSWGANTRSELRSLNDTISEKEEK